MRDASPPDGTSAHGAHFESTDQEAHAAKLGIWVFLGSEMLLFAGLFALFATYRMHFPVGFGEGVRQNTKVLGSVNTGLLLLSSTLAASSVHALRAGRARRAFGLIVGTAALGVVFLAIKMTEYQIHFREGIVPGGASTFFDAHREPGLATFWTLYYLTTGLHAVHVTVGVLLLLATAVGVVSGSIRPHRARRLEIAALYWHLVDLVWIFVWPLFYLAGSSAR